MFYWENGFYTKQNAANTRALVSLEEWEMLLAKQSEGYEIYTNDFGRPAYRMHVQTEQEKLVIELGELEEWFNYYDSQVKQYTRCVRTGVLFDKNIDELDAMAAVKAQRIAQIRNLI